MRRWIPIGLLPALPALAAGQSDGAFRLPCGAEIHTNESQGFLAFPQDETFCPLLADPKQARSFVAYQRGEFGTLDEADVNASSIGAVGLGDSFGLFRWGGGRRPGDGFHLALDGAIFAQFDLETSSIDLINADYLIGLPLTWRRSGFSTRLRLYHQSSHLGDEYLLRGDDIQRENLSFESAEILLSLEAGFIRFYGGGEALFRREPDELDAYLAHGGIELRSGAGRSLAVLVAADVKLSEQQDWNAGVSARAGLQISPGTRGGHPIRQVLVLAEFYDGPSPYGQFFLDRIRYAGIGVHLFH